MSAWITELLDPLGLTEFYSQLLTTVISLLVIMMVGLLANYIAKKLLNNFATKIADKTPTKIDDLLIEKGVFAMLAHIAPALTVFFMLPILGDWAKIFEEVIISAIIVMIVIAIFRILDAFVESVKGRSRKKAGAIKGMISVIKIGLGVLAGLLIVVTFLGNDRGWAVFSSIGGLSAVLLLVFRDSILGLVAGFQLSSDNLLKLGDWLEMPKYNADGEVVDISLTKIKVKNWDKTYTSIPAYKFLEESFKNWEGMTESGGRRIKRPLYIDLNTIGFLSEQEQNKLEEIEVMSDYFMHKKDELSKYNLSVKGSHPANRRRLTNIGTYRAYIKAYLENNPNIHQGMTLLVRQLAPSEQGMPIEVYCFTNDTTWANYEGIQSDIFDHLYAVMPSFGLKPFQKVSGNDFSSSAAIKF